MDDYPNIEGLWTHKETGEEVEVVLITDETLEDVRARTTLSEGSLELGNYAFIRAVREYGTHLTANKDNLDYMLDYMNGYCVQGNVNHDGFTVLGEPGICLD